ncbi:MAG: Asp-tRNA(Asn)/Glu-tRNA(Gln) amidotransferase subunit GatA [bacterium]
MLFNRTCRELSKLLKKGDVSSVSLTRLALERIKAIDLNSFVTVCEEAAFEAAEEADRALRSGRYVNPLCGIPVAVKDNMATRDMETTCGSRILKGFVPPFDATAVEKLKSAGMVIVGKTNMDEFAMGSSNENSGYGPVRNPWDTERVPGGSSGGSAAAVAARQVPLALGSDTGGSIRQPASFCGTVGLKPTYGRVSRYGLVAFASSLDQIGTIAGCVDDCALLLSVIAGEDPRDSTSVPIEVPKYPELWEGSINGVRIGIPKEYYGDGLEDEVRTAIENALHMLEELGARTVHVSLPHTDYTIATYYLIANAEASSNLARYDGVRYGYRASNFSDIASMYSRTRDEGFGDEVKRRIMLGTYALSAGYYDAYYLRALKVRTLIKSDFDRVFQDVDCIVTPTSPTVAFKIGEKIDDPLSMYLSDIYTTSTNLAGLPGINLPCGFSDTGLPIGMQIIGRAFDEVTVLKVAGAYESSSGHASRIPPAAEVDVGV